MTRGSFGRSLIALACGVCLLSVPGCRPDDQETGSVNTEAGQEARRALPEPVTVQLDSGSTAFRADDYETARRHYREAARLAPDEASAWFGVYMAEQALGDTAAADSALSRVRELAPGATLLDTPAHDTAGGS